jgi:hypothetical protein
MDRRWRKKISPLEHNATLVISPQLIRSVVNDDADESTPESLYDFVYELDEATLYRLGASILEDQQFWLVLREFIINGVESLHFVRMMKQMDEQND